jgi:hypothetical protein
MTDHRFHGGEAAEIGAVGGAGELYGAGLAGEEQDIVDRPREFQALMAGARHRR